MIAAVLDEGALEPGVAPQVLAPIELGANDVDNGDPADVVGDVRRHHTDPEQQSVGVDEPELFALRIFLPPS